MTSLLLLRTSAITAILLAGGSGVAAAKEQVGTGPTVSSASPTRTTIPPRINVWTGVYTAEQATRGGQAYQQLCSRCHRDDLSGGKDAPSLVGSAFFDRWNELTLLDTFALIQSVMPHDHYVFVSADAARDLISFLLQRNGIPAGTTELSKDTEKLKAIIITRAPPK